VAAALRALQRTPHAVLLRQLMRAAPLACPTLRSARGCGAPARRDGTIALLLLRSSCCRWRGRRCCSNLLLRLRRVRRRDTATADASCSEALSRQPRLRDRCCRVCRKFARGYKDQ
jgi:hypothetical protein